MPKKNVIKIEKIGLVKNDSWLEPYEAAIVGRHEHALYKIKEPLAPTPIEIVTFDFFYYLSILFKKKEL